MKKSKKINDGLKTFVVLLSNHVDRRDDESITVRARTAKEAEEKAVFNSNRFSIRSVMTLAESKKNWA